MPDMHIDGGRRQGRTLANESGLLYGLAAQAMFAWIGAESGEVFTKLNNVWFRVSPREDGSVKYTALPQPPAGAPAKF